MKLIVLAVVFSLCVVSGFSQRTETKSSDVRSIKNRPHVYVNFEREGKIDPLYDGESGERVWIRFHNNSKWTVLFCSESLPEEYGQIGAVYETERYQGEGEKPEAGSSDACRFKGLMPGRSIVFSVPREHLAKGLAIKIKYRYEWEFETDGSHNSLEPKHYVYFYSSDIPKK